MQESQRQQVADETTIELVMRWSGLDPAHKIAWRQLWDIAGRKARSVRIHCKLVGEYQGADDPHRTGGRLLKGLERHNLIYVHSKEGGLWTFFLENPVEVERRRIVRASAEFQPELFAEAEAPEEPAAVSFGSNVSAVGAPRPPNESDSAVRAPRPPTEMGEKTPAVSGSSCPESPAVPENSKSGSAVSAPRPPTEDDSAVGAPRPPPPCTCDVDKDQKIGVSNVDVHVHGGGGLGARTAFTPMQESSPKPRGQPKPSDGLEILRQRRDQAAKHQAPDDSLPTFADIVKPKMVSIVASQAARPQKMELIVEWILRVVNDPNMNRKRCYKIAEAVLDGCYPESDLSALLHATKDIKPNRPGMSEAQARGSYFNKTISAVFAELGLFLTDKKSAVRAPRPPDKGDEF